MLNYKQLYYFWHVARIGSITRAAQKLHLTPQTISGQISELEHALGLALFRRVGRRLELTAAGRLALTQANDIFQLGTELEQALRRGAGEQSFLVGITDAVPKSIAFQLLAPAMKLPEPMRLICHEDRPEQLFAELAIHKLDLVITDRPLPAELGVKGYNHLLGRCAVAFFAVPELAECYRAGFPRSLNDAPLLLPGDKAAIHGLLEDWFAEQQIRPHVIGKFDDTTLMKSFGKAGVGIFPSPLVMADEIGQQYGARMIGIAPDVLLSYYAISIERRLTHPAVKAVSEAAKQTLFAVADAGESGT